MLRYGTAEFGEDGADAYYFSFEDAFLRLQQFPEAGQVEEESGLALRRWHHRSHRIFYTYDGTRLFIARILHHSVSLEGRFLG